MWRVFAECAVVLFMVLLILSLAVFAAPENPSMRQYGFFLLFLTGLSLAPVVLTRHLLDPARQQRLGNPQNSQNNS